MTIRFRSRHIILLCFWPLASVATPQFVGLGDLPGVTNRSFALAIAGDGTTVVGDARIETGNREAFRWRSDTGIVGLGDLPGGLFWSQARAVSDDGSVVAGMGNVNASLPVGGFEAFRWSEDAGIVGLGSLPGGAPGSVAHGISGDGTVVVGRATRDSGEGAAFRWTASDGMVALGSLPGGAGSGARSHAWNISADGSTIIGEASSTFGERTAFRWTEGGGMESLGDLPGGRFASAALGASLDGSTIVGLATSAVGLEAFRWTEDGGMVSLGDLLGGDVFSIANATTADGSVVVGSGRTDSGNEAFIWDEQNGMRRLQDYLADVIGLDLDGWTLLEGIGISADGRAMTGTGVNPFGREEAWYAVIPEPNTAVLLSLGLIALATGRRRAESVQNGTNMPRSELLFPIAI